MIERSSKIDVLPQAQKKKEFKAADHQQYKLASPECQGDNPVPLLHLPTRIVDDAPASEKCSFINFPFLFRNFRNNLMCSEQNHGRLFVMVLSHTESQRKGSRMFSRKMKEFVCNQFLVS